jgi:hypothetical protein
MSCNGQDGWGGMFGGLGCNHRVLRAGLQYLIRIALINNLNMGACRTLDLTLPSAAKQAKRIVAQLPSVYCCARKSEVLSRHTPQSYLSSSRSVHRIVSSSLISPAITLSNLS